jgi:hypothetical protein
MSNEMKTDNTNTHSGAAKNDANRTTQTPKSGQQSQGNSPQTDRSATQQGGSDHKSGQQSQGGSQSDSDRMKQGGSSSANKDPAKANDVTQKSNTSK